MSRTLRRRMALIQPTGTPTSGSRTVSNRDRVGLAHSAICFAESRGLQVIGHRNARGRLRADIPGAQENTVAAIELDLVEAEPGAISIFDGEVGSEFLSEVLFVSHVPDSVGWFCNRTDWSSHAPYVLRVAGPSNAGSFSSRSEIGGLDRVVTRVIADCRFTIVSSMSHPRADTEWPYARFSMHDAAFAFLPWEGATSIPEFVRRLQAALAEYDAVESDVADYPTWAALLCTQGNGFAAHGFRTIAPADWAE